jgi:hypothetical protein
MIAESEQKNPYIVERRYCIKILLYDVAFLNVLQLVKGQSAPFIKTLKSRKKNEQRKVVLMVYEF